MSHIPHPATIEEIHALIELEKEENVGAFMANRRYSLEGQVWNVLRSIGVGSSINTSTIDNANSSLFNAYSFFRGAIQTNEAINKVIGTAELLNALRPSNEIMIPLCETFNVEFSGGTIIPTLYYAEISALTSLLSLFGCVLIRDNTNKTYNLVRTQNGWKIFYRNDHINRLQGQRVTGNWHNQIINLITGMRRHLDDFPVMPIGVINGLYEARNRAHYSVLGSVSVSQTKGLKDYFDFLPTVINTINTALGIVHDIWGGPHFLGGFRRFKELHSNVLKLYDRYTRDEPVLDPLLY